MPEKDKRRKILNKKTKYRRYSILLISFLLCSCTSLSPSLKAKNELPSKPMTPKNSSDIQQSDALQQVLSVNFKGIRLQTNIPSVSDIVASEELVIPLEEERDKPDYVQPRHILLRFMGEYAEQHKESFFSPEIKIFPISEFRQTLSKSKSYVEQFDKELNTLQKILSKKLPKIDEVPRIPFYDGSPAIITHVKYISFKNVKGFLYVTQFNIEPSIINNQGLTCIFQGITSDKKYYVLATFPVTTLFLPNDRTDSYSGYEIPNDYYDSKRLKENEKRYDKYLSVIQNKLEATQGDEFLPDLRLIELTLSSLEIEPDLFAERVVDTQK